MREGQGEEREQEPVSKAPGRWRVTALWPVLATVGVSTESRYDADGWLVGLRLFKRVSYVEKQCHTSGTFINTGVIRMR